jgi:hypothetical protein
MTGRTSNNSDAEQATATIGKGVEQATTNAGILHFVQDDDEGYGSG